jgi:UDP-N-acetylglucosamine diphosphorylase/glucosamine-1-phosphate N-acetyltransferase
MNIILFDETGTWKNLLPLTYTRPVSEIRIGILTIKEKWEQVSGLKVEYSTQEFLSEKFYGESNVQSFFINSSVIPDEKLFSAISKLKPGESLGKGEKLIAYNSVQTNPPQKKFIAKPSEYPESMFFIENVWDIFSKNGEALKRDFELVTKGRKTQPLSQSNTLIGDLALIFLEEGAKAEACIFNTSSGPIYIGKNAEVMEGSVVRGPFSLGEESALKLSTKIYGPTTIGPHSKVGGEVNNSVIFGYSNKAHDGFLGNSVIGEWCNLGADTNNSNLKNNYGNVKLYSYTTGKNEDTGLQFCGLIMGDHSKSGINTMFNTGTVVGVGANIYGGGFPPTHIPSFAWGGAEKMEPYRLDKMFETTERVMSRRRLNLNAIDKKILEHIFEESVPLRKF